MSGSFVRLFAAAQRLSNELEAAGLWPEVNVSGLSENLLDQAEAWGPRTTVSHDGWEWDVVRVGRVIFTGKHRQVRQTAEIGPPL